MYFRIAWLFAAVLLAAGCGEGGQPQPAPKGATDIEGYRKWPLRQAGVRGEEAHGASADVYANNIVHDYFVHSAVTGTTAVVRYPEGAILVQDVFDAEGELQEVLVMRKLRDGLPGGEAHGGWVWSTRRSPAGLDSFQGKEACFECHTQANTPNFRDGVFVFPQCAATLHCNDQ